MSVVESTSVDTLTGTGTRRTATVPAAAPAPMAKPVAPRTDPSARYTISEVAALTGLSAHTLRWYERIGLMPHVDRSHTGQRRFTPRDLDWLTFVGKLRTTGMAVSDMVRYAELIREGDHTHAERRALLEGTRHHVVERIAELQDALSMLDLKIDHYQSIFGGTAS
ncbi:MerR family transcriptional regulator [Streptomyces laurentii]|uniref:MerR family transcriptional regulator n=1 Tax=Streptomyces laurentii TaxID=39478 RepID=UPI0036B20544